MSLDLGTLTGYVDLDDKKFEGVLDKLPEKLKGKGAILALGAGAAAVGIGAALSQGIEQNIDSADASAKLTAQLGLTKEESARIGGIAGKLYSQNFGNSIEETSTAVSQVVSSIDGMRGASASTVEAMTAKFLNFNTTFEVDTARSTQVVGQMLKSGLVKDANEGVDLLTGAFQKVPANVREDLLDALDEYSPFFTQLGINGSTSMGLLINASAKGAFGIDKTGDALKEFTIRSTDMSTASGAAYKALGMDQKAMTDQILAGGPSASKAFGDIVHGLQSIHDPAMQSQAALALFGTPLEDLGTGAIPDFLGQIDPAGDAFDTFKGKADDMGKAINSGPTANMATLTRQFQGTMAEITAGVIPVLQDVLKFLGAHPEVIKAVAIAVGILAAAFIGLSAAMWIVSLNPVMLTIFAIVAGVALLAAGVYLLVTHWGAVVDFLTNIWGGFVGWFTGIIDGMVSWWNGLWSGVGDAISTGFGAVIDFLTGLPGMFLGLLQNAGMAILSGLATGLALGVVAVVYFFTQFPSDLQGWLVGAAVWLVSTGFAILTGLYNGIVNGAVAVGAWFASLPGWVLGLLASAGTWLMTTGVQMLLGLLVGIGQGEIALGAWLLSLPGKVVGYLATAGTWLVTTGGNVIRGMVSGISSLISSVPGALASLPGTIQNALAGAGSWLVGAGRNIVDGLMAGLKSMAGTVGSFFLGLLPSWIVGPFKAALGIHSPSTVFAEFGVNTMQGYINGVESMRAAANDSLSSLIAQPVTSTGPGSSQGAQGASGGSGEGVTTVDASTNFYGDIHNMDADELARDISQRKAFANDQAGISGLIGVA